MRDMSLKTFRKRRSAVVLLVLLALLVVGIRPEFARDTPQVAPITTEVLSESTAGNELASDVLERLEVKGRASKTGYSRDEYGNGWATVAGCDMRNIMLARGMTETKLATDNCVVLSGTLPDPYTGKTIEFVRGNKTSSLVQIDHVVALSDSWQKGAQNLDAETRQQLANDPLELLAVDGPANQEKGDGDAATWLPPNKSFRCQYVARQIAVKAKYSLWVTEAEKSAMKRVLSGCEMQVVPSVK
jgi:hypothetical protein